MRNNLKQRTFDFAVAVAKLIPLLPNTIINRPYLHRSLKVHLLLQQHRASQRAKSSGDFLNKLKIVEEEADETIFFLDVLRALNTDHAYLIQPLITEGTEILKIIVASDKSVRTKMNATSK